LRSSPSDRARDLFDTYTRDLSRDDIQRLFTDDTRDAYRFFTRGHDEDRYAGLPLWKSAPLRLREFFIAFTLRLSPARAEEWLESYLDQLLTRDAELLGESRDPHRLRRFFEVLALSSAGIVTDKTVFEAARINAKTAAAYTGLLQNLLVVEALPAWWTNRLKRLVQAPKRYITDPSLVGAALRVDTRAVLGDGDLLGRLLDTFVVAQLRAEIPVSVSRPRLYHLRQEGGRHEVDILVELGGGRVIGLEVKASAAPTRDDGRHLACPDRARSVYRRFWDRSVSSGSPRPRWGPSTSCASACTPNISRRRTSWCSATRTSGCVVSWPSASPRTAGSRSSARC